MNLQGRVLKTNLNGDDVRLLHHELGLLGFRSIPEAETLPGVFGRGTEEAVREFQQSAGLQVTGVVDEATARAINERVASAGPPVAAIPGTYTVEGSVTSPDRAGVGELLVQIVDRNAGLNADVSLKTTTTDERGNYTVNFTWTAPSAQKTQPDLQARVFLKAISEKPLAVSEARYNATLHETLNVRLPAQSTALPSEHETLTAMLKSYFSGSLKDLQETEAQQDVTYLANKCAWDARAVAMAALADQLYSDVHVHDPNGYLDPAFFYALFRAGLPANETLYLTDIETVGRVWQQAIDQGVIPQSLKDGDRIQRAKGIFRILCADHLLKAQAIAGTSSMADMLALTLSEETQRSRFAELYTLYRGDLPTFWQEVEKPPAPAGGGFGPAVAKRLQLDGQLAYLTLNNAPLMSSLRATVSSPLDLVKGGYHSAEKWKPLLATAPIPVQIPGAKLDEKRTRYAELLAAQVRFSFSTAVIAERIRSGEIKVPSEVKDQVVTFLTQQGHFEIGTQPVEQFLAGTTLTPDPKVVEQVKRLERVYQITPNDQAMVSLLNSDLDSAYKVVRYEEEELVRLYVKDHPEEEQTARLIYAKAKQVYNTALNVASSYLLSRNAPGLGVSQGSAVVLPAPPPTLTAAPDVIAYPTLEKLFGSLDFCACEHCRSILSPAAYLVDLLLFIDRPKEVWDGKENPQSVLLDRRPDIQHLPLTCENTNTPLPYIDLVNETLEYFVAHDSLKDYPGHDTGDRAAPEELLASPQFVEDAAYARLKATPFPPPLPFHQPLEALRRYFDKLEVPLQDAMEALRKDEILGGTVKLDGDSSYDWRDILMEELQLSRAECRLLTEHSLTLLQMYGFPAGTFDDAAMKELAKVKAFSRRVGITYEEAFALLQTRFINPNGWLIPRLERLHVPFATLKALKDGKISDQAFKDLLPAGLDLAQYGKDKDVPKWVKDDTNYARIMGLIVVANPDPAHSTDLCSIDFLELRYSNPDTSANFLLPIDFVRLLRFLRLWKKLGLTIDQTDQLITALAPAGDATDLQKLDDAFLTLLPRLGIVFRLIDRLGLTPDDDLQALLACWSPLGTYGPDALYRKVFLSPALLRLDAVFADDGYGNFLKDPNAKLLDHAEALRAACGLTGEELSLIVADRSLKDALLTLDNVSEIFRRGWLARKLRLSVKELLLLIHRTGFNPFAAPAPPAPPIEKLLDLVESFRAASLQPVQALYLVWNDDVSGKSVPEERQIHDLARSLRAGFAAIESELTVASAPDVQVARARMAQVYGGEATDFFFGLLEGTLRFDVTYTHDTETLEPAILEAAPGRIAYDSFRKRLSCSGILSDATRGALKDAAKTKPDFGTAVESLYTAGQNAMTPFFARYPDLQPLYSDYAASTKEPEKKREALLNALLVKLKAGRKRQQALAIVSTAMRIDPAFAQALLTDGNVLHAQADATRPALDDLLALETPGPMGISFFQSLNGYLEAPVNGLYHLQIEQEGTKDAKLRLGGQDVTLDKNGNVWSTHQPVELTAGILYSILITAEGVTKPPAVRWRTEGRGWESIPESQLYYFALVDQLRSTTIRFLKASSLATALKMTANEIVHFAARDEYKIGNPKQGWLNALPVSGGADTATATALRDVLTALLDFARLKAELSPDDERLLAVLRNPAAVLNGSNLLLSLTGWEDQSLTDLLPRLGLTRADLSRIGKFRRAHDAYAVTRKLGISASALLSSATNEPSPDTVRDLQSALRARYDESGWLAVIRPINDELRGLQRNALVACVLRKLAESTATRDVDTPDKLFEYFLMDVQMEPCMQTSRIRHALSSVQLFIERCLMNLELRVSPATIIGKQWEWMKRYRVWEANRKVFLWPENWLEPELRDDQSPFFKEAMSELLQSDITEDSAATALLNYLSKLEEVAKLEPCGFHFVENEPGTADDVAHVVARTAGAHRKYYYRRREGISWSPWEQIRLDIEDNPVLPVVWNNRLLLFWLKILKQGPPTMQKPGTAGAPLTSLKTSDLGVPITLVQAVLCWSEYYNGKWQPAKTSDVERPTELGKFFTPADLFAFDRSKLFLTSAEDGGALRIQIDGSGASQFVLYNTHSLPVRWEDLPPPAHGSTPPERLRSLESNKGTFSVLYGTVDAVEHVFWDERPLFNSAIPERTVEAGNPLQNVWDAPFFFEDSRHVFYVTTTEQSASELPGFGFSVQSAKGTLTGPPPLVMPDPAPVKDRQGSFPRGLSPGLVDRSPVERFVSEDAYIRTGLATTASVRYGGLKIGPAGVLPNRRLPRP
ncbi:MAG: peptidoglycan-binding protein [Acidobacteria bacterium]|nr:peptidoglycan-binding protein [Acidobacteriota bacterium]